MPHRAGESWRNSGSLWEYGSLGTGRLYVNGKLVGEERLTPEPGFLGFSWCWLGIWSPVIFVSSPPFRFSGTLEKVTIEVK
jgi:hypothetical protein